MPPRNEAEEERDNQAGLTVVGVVEVVDGVDDGVSVVEVSLDVVVVGVVDAVLGVGASPGLSTVSIM